VMCGPANFEAVHLCLTRAVELSAAGAFGWAALRGASPLLSRLRRLRLDSGTHSVEVPTEAAGAQVDAVVP
jgi:hypothetical protein